MKKRFLAGVMVAALGLTLVACGGGSKAAFKDGDYKATTKGHNGDLTVNVQVTDGKIEDIKVNDHEETEGIFDGVQDNLIPEIIKKQSTEGVDTISGATVSSNAVIEAVNKALEEAK
ncbi:FMN-binding protein [Clostridium sp. MSJ-11]|uniref:FMN-binding protein n=1 Tax=Clostridium mobile TaxID=2841512 RepID=A0ABS6ECH8_9CLOT|nr:FMN-binding protein [Clostridium mobile]MBU5482894.1 FMN-binding protein [Clostridium mobile]